MAAVTLSTERPVLTVNVDGEREVGVPLTMTHAELLAWGAAESPDTAFMDFCRAYLGDVVDKIGDADINALAKAWGDARRGLGQPDAGEPSASPVT